MKKKAASKSKKRDGSKSPNANVYKNDMKPTKIPNESVLKGRERAKERRSKSRESTPP